MPLKLPQGWVWTTLGEIASSILYGVSESAKNKGAYRLLRITDIQNNKVKWQTVPFTDYDDSKAQAYLLKNGDILFARTGATVGKSYLVGDISEPSIYASYLIRLRMPAAIPPSYIKFFFESDFYWEQISINSVGIGQPNVNGTALANLSIPLPPLAEQTRIVAEIERWFAFIDTIEQGKESLQTAIKQAKSKILDLAIHGKLVPQDPNDEPASELLKRINPKAEITCDNRHYPKLPAGWATCRLGDIIEYEQPTKYIVKSTAYNDNYPTPVLTAGKSFVIGYTNETDGIYNRLPCIIFDDFTTESRLVNLPFKVKSSAMKILQVHHEVEIEYVVLFMSVTRLISDTHKRYWISEYSKLAIPIPPLLEQRKIIKVIHRIWKSLNTIEGNL